MVNLGNCYFGGKGVKKDRSKAHALYAQAYELGNDLLGQ